MKRFFTPRWQGRIGWRTLFWRDLLLIGTGLNLPWVVLVHLLPLPYNLFIVSAIWSAPNRPTVVCVFSAFWLLLLIVV